MSDTFPCMINYTNILTNVSRVLSFKKKIGKCTTRRSVPSATSPSRRRSSSSPHAKAVRATACSPSRSRGSWRSDLVGGLCYPHATPRRWVSRRAPCARTYRRSGRSSCLLRYQKCCRSATSPAAERRRRALGRCSHHQT